MNWYSRERIETGRRAKHGVVPFLDEDTAWVWMEAWQDWIMNRRVLARSSSERKQWEEKKAGEPWPCQDGRHLHG